MYRNYMQKRSCNCNCDNECIEKPHCDCAWNNNDDNNCFQCACANVANYNNMVDDCACGFDEGNDYFPENPMYAQSYVPFQTMNQTFIPCVGLKMGTIFPELVSPYMPGQSQREIDYIKNANKIKKGCNG